MQSTSTATPVSTADDYNPSRTVPLGGGRSVEVHYVRFDQLPDLIDFVAELGSDAATLWNGQADADAANIRNLLAGRERFDKLSRIIDGAVTPPIEQVRPTAGEWALIVAELVKFNREDLEAHIGPFVRTAAEAVGEWVRSRTAPAVEEQNPPTGEN